MSTEQSRTLEPFIKRRQKNLAYFEKRHPEIYKLFKDHKLTTLQLNILTETDEVNILKDGEHVYPEGAKKYAHEEVEVFRKSYRQGSIIRSFVPPVYGDYMFPRFGQIAVNELLEKSPVRKENFQWMELGNFYPMIVFLGCGLGYHIEEMVKHYDVHNLMIVEPNLDVFAASLYSVDWDGICSGYHSSEGRILHFIIGAEESEYLLWAVTWNRLIELSPHFPIMTLFYNHQGRELFDRVSDKINKDLFVFLLSWGHYDDEIRQLNNALHNFHRGIRQLPAALEKGSKTPVFVVGAGPSLDGRIDFIRQVRDKAIIISCGTALRSLAAYDLKPDIHVELESDLLAYIAVSQASKDPGFYKDIKLVGPSHISPLIYELFGDGRMYYKAESATSELFGKEGGHVIRNATPTCTNLGVGLAVSMGFQNIFLFGLDFGFRDVSQHHSKNSIYYEKLLKLEHKEKDLVRVETVDGSLAWTTPNYFTSKRKLENLFLHYEGKRELNVYNCSDTAAIEETKWLPTDTFIDVVKACKNTKKQDMHYIFNGKAKSFPLAKVAAKLKYLEQNFQGLAHDITRIVSEPINSSAELSLRCGRLDWYLEDVLRMRTPDFYFFIRGAVRHFLCAGFAHTFIMRDESERMAYIRHWQAAVMQFFNKLPDHFRSVVHKEFDDSDPWLKQAITDREDGINPYFTESLEGLQLTF